MRGYVKQGHPKGKGKGAVPRGTRVFAKLQVVRCNWTVHPGDGRLAMRSGRILEGLRRSSKETGHPLSHLSSNLLNQVGAKQSEERIHSTGDKT